MSYAKCLAGVRSRSVALLCFPKTFLQPDAQLAGVRINELAARREPLDLEVIRARPVRQVPFSSLPGSPEQIVDSPFKESRIVDNLESETQTWR